MPGHRKLKKDINNLCCGVINECFAFLDYTPSLNQENIQVIISDTNELRNQLIHMINHHPKPGNSSVVYPKAYYRKIREELYDKTIDLIDRLNSLPR